MTNKEKEELKQEVDEMVGLIQFENIPDYSCHLKGCIDSELRWGYNDGKWKKTKELIKLCRVAILKKNWKPVYDFIII